MEFAKDLFEQCRDFFEWVVYDVLTYNSIKCCFCDIYNFFSGFVFIFCLFAFTYAGINLAKFVLWNVSVSIIDISLLAAAILLMGILLCLRIYLVSKSNQSAIQYPQSENLSDSEDHTAIIFPHYSGFLDQLFILDCVSLLVMGFRKKNKKYRIYHITEAKEFVDAYRNPRVTEIWVIGHGSHGSLVFGDKIPENRIEYSKLEKLNRPKKCIVQLHCNHGKKLSLKDINKCNGFVSKYSRAAFHNRCYIINKLKIFEKTGAWIC